MSPRSCQLVSGVAVAIMSAASVAGPLSPEERHSIALPEVAPVTLTYREVDSLKGSSADDLLTQELTQRALEATGMPSHREVKADGTILVSGARMTYLPAKHELVAFYEAHEIGREGLVLGQTIAMPIHVEVAKEGDLRIVRLTFPSQARSASKKVLFVSAPQLNIDEVLADYARVVSAVQRAEIRLQTRVSGELESKFRPDAVLANFERLMGRARSSNGSARAETSLTENFLFKGTGFNTVVAVNAFPYRDGSKIQYSANVPLKLEPDGTVQGDDGVKVVQDAVARVVND